MSHISITVQEIHYSTYIIRNAKDEAEAVQALQNDLGSIHLGNGNVAPEVEIEHIMTEFSHANLEPELWKIETSN